MFTVTDRATRRVAAMGFAAIFAAGGLALATPAAATDGRTAVGLCIDSTASGARCEWAVGKDGSIDICNKSGCVTCPSAEGQCTVASIVHRPPRFLPIGTKVTTSVGEFTVGAPPQKGGIDGVIKGAGKAK